MSIDTTPELNPKEAERVRKAQEAKEAKEKRDLAMTELANKVKKDAQTEIEKIESQRNTTLTENEKSEITLRIWAESRTAFDKEELEKATGIKAEFLKQTARISENMDKTRAGKITKAGLNALLIGGSIVGYALATGDQEMIAKAGLKTGIRLGSAIGINTLLTSSTIMNKVASLGEKSKEFFGKIFKKKEGNEEETEELEINTEEIDESESEEKKSLIKTALAKLKEMSTTKRIIAAAGIGISFAVSGSWILAAVGAGGVIAKELIENAIDKAIKNREEKIHKSLNDFADEKLAELEETYKKLKRLKALKNFSKIMTSVATGIASIEAAEYEIHKEIEINNATEAAEIAEESNAIPTPVTTQDSLNNDSMNVIPTPIIPVDSLNQDSIVTMVPQDSLLNPQDTTIKAPAGLTDTITPAQPVAIDSTIIKAQVEADSLAKDAKVKLENAQKIADEAREKTEEAAKAAQLSKENAADQERLKALQKENEVAQKALEEAKQLEAQAKIKAEEIKNVADNASKTVGGNPVDGAKISLGKDGVPKNLETVFQSIALNHMNLEDTDLDNADKFLVDTKNGSMSLNMAANMVKLAEGNDVAGFKAEEFKDIATFDAKTGTLEIKDKVEFDAFISRLEAHSEELWDKGVLQKGAVAYLDNISNKNWLDMVHADKVPGIEGHDNVTQEQIEDFSKNQMVQDAEAKVEKVISKDEILTKPGNVTSLDDQTIIEPERVTSTDKIENEFSYPGWNDVKDRNALDFLQAGLADKLEGNDLRNFNIFREAYLQALDHKDGNVPSLIDIQRYNPNITVGELMKKAYDANTEFALGEDDTEITPKQDEVVEKTPQEKGMTQARMMAQVEELKTEKSNDIINDIFTKKRLFGKDILGLESESWKAIKNMEIRELIYMYNGKSLDKDQIEFVEKLQELNGNKITADEETETANEYLKKLLTKESEEVVRQRNEDLQNLEDLKPYPGNENTGTKPNASTQRSLGRNDRQGGGYTTGGGYTI